MNSTVHTYIITQETVCRIISNVRLARLGANCGAVLRGGGHVELRSSPRLHLLMALLQVSAVVRRTHKGFKSSPD